MAEIEIEVGGSLRDMLAEVASAWRDAQRFSGNQATHKLCFVDWAGLCSVMTPKRYELIQHLHAQPAPSIRALARALGRDVKRVHEDVVSLEELGLIMRDRETGKLWSELSEISSKIKFTV